MANATHYTDIMTNNTTGIIDLMQKVNTATGSFFGYTLILAVFAITYLSISQYYARDSLLVASFMAFLTAIFLYAMAMVASTAVVITLILIIATYFLGGRHD